MSCCKKCTVYSTNSLLTVAAVVVNSFAEARQRFNVNQSHPQRDKRVVSPRHTSFFPFHIRRTQFNNVIECKKNCALVRFKIIVMNVT